jgi:signal transduction histidine kinase
METSDYYVQSFGIQDGLPHELTHRIVQDKTGYLWISTSGGLVRYDGNQLQLFSSPLISSEESDVIYAITRGFDGNLWAAPNCGGLVEFQPETGTFVQRAGQADFPANPPAFLAEMPDGAFWAGYYDAHLLRWKDGRATWFTRTNGLVVGQTISLAADPAGRIWVASDSFLGSYENGQLVRRFDAPGTKLRLGRGGSGEIWVVGAHQLQKLEDGKLSCVTTNLPWAGVSGTPSVVFEDSRGTVWIGTKGLGLYCFAKNTFDRVPTSHPWITDINEDHEGNLWVTTRGGGINRLRLKGFEVWDVSSGLPESVPTSICQDARSNLWIAYDGKCLVELQKRLLNQRREFQTDLWKYSLLVCPDHDDQLWIATRSALLRWRAGQEPVREPIGSRTNVSVHVLYCRRNGELWVGGEYGFLGRWRQGQWSQFDQLRDAIGASMVRCLGEDREGTLWVGLNDGNMLRFQNDTFTHLNRQDGLPGSMIRSILCDSAGHLWMATTRDGLLLRYQGGFRRVTCDQGFPREVVDQMLEDNSGRIWFATQVGLYHVDCDELFDCALGKIPRIQPISYGRDAGLVGYSIVNSYQPSAWKSSDGHLWFATHKGIISVNPAALKQETNPPPVLVDEVLLDDRPVPVRNPLRLPATTRKLDVRLSVIYLSAPDQVRVRHWLEGFDSTWVESGSQRSFTYPKLAPGTYKLRFSACNLDGVWNDQTIPLSLVVVPAWWQLRSLQLATVAALVGLLILAVRSWSHRRLKFKLERLEQKQAMEKERARIAKNLHDDLGASLTEIGLLADLARRNGTSPEGLKDVTGFFSERVRGLARTLDTIVWTVNPTNDSLAELATYLCEFSQELFGMSSIRCRLDVSGEIPPCPLSPEERSNLFLTAKEAMNNIIKHSGATEAWLSIRMEGDRFCISIRDNGRGFRCDAPENAKRNGLANMRSRIQELNGSFALTSAPGAGTTIAISIRLAGIAQPHPPAPAPTPSATPQTHANHRSDR